MACGACSAKNKKDTFVHKDASGKTTSFNTEVEAKAAVARKGGSYKKVTK